MEEADKKKRKKLREQAKREKKAADVGILINSELDIMKAFTQLGPIPGAMAAPLISITKGNQLWAETRKTQTGSVHIYSLNTTSGKDIYFYTNSSGNDGLNIYITNGGGYVFGGSNNNAWNAEQSKVCLMYNSTTNRLAYFINGSLYGEQTNVLNLGQTDYSDLIANNNIFEIKEHKFYTNALTDAEVITLTTI